MCGRAHVFLRRRNSVPPSVLCLAAARVGQCNQPELALDYLARHGHGQNPDHHLDDTAHLAVVLHLFCDLHIADDGAGSGADGAMGALLVPSGSGGRPAFKLYVLLQRYLDRVLAGGVKDAVELVALVRNTAVRRQLLVVRVPSLWRVRGFGLADWCWCGGWCWEWWCGGYCLR